MHAAHYIHAVLQQRIQRTLCQKIILLAHFVNGVLGYVTHRIVVLSLVIRDGPSQAHEGEGTFSHLKYEIIQ
jgi:hypothetical protein